jgi:outer membrane protein OmpA-like peptidoglycan-associated protein
MLKRFLHYLPVYLIFAALTTRCSFARAQSADTLQVIPDSAHTSAKEQLNEFNKNNYPFPPKPRSRWELGIKGGLPAGGTDVRYWGPTFGAGIHLRKALGYIFSLRAEFDWMRLRGLNWQPSTFWQKNPVLSAYYQQGQPVFYNYQSTVHELSLQAVASISNIIFHKTNSRWNFYVFGGIAGMTYSTFYKVLDKSGKPYDYSGILARYNGMFDYGHRNDIRKALKNLLDGPWSTMAQRDPSQPTLGKAPFRVATVVGAGIQYRLSGRWSLSLEDKLSSPRTDLLDGQMWQEVGVPGVMQSTPQTVQNDSYHFVTFGINYSMGSSKRTTEPLWWKNPLEYAYGELNDPRHGKQSKGLVTDADGDGVPDQLDKEPNTPAGCPVDSRGISRDTDGDGIPDCRDKELITPTRCQPVDANGVGKCPEPACCKEIEALKTRLAEEGMLGCSIGDLPSIGFKGSSVRLSKEDRILLGEAAKRMRENPECKVAVIGYGQSSKAVQQLSWDRVNTVVNYLVEKEGIGSDRLIFRYGQTGGDENTIDLRGVNGEQGGNAVPPPHPALRKK